MVIGPKPLISRKKGREGYAAGCPGVNTIRSGKARLRTLFSDPESQTDPSVAAATRDTSQLDGGSLWMRCMRALEDELPGEHFNMWVRPLQAVESSGALKLLAPNRFAVDWVNAHLLSRLGEIVRRFVEGDAPIVTVEVGSRGPEVVRTLPVDANAPVRPKRSEG